MTSDVPSARPMLTTLPSWRALSTHAEQMRDVHLRTLFADDASRGERFSAEAAGLYLEYSKNRITDETIRLLVDLADACGLRDRVEAMFQGERINTTEERAVLHVALRAPRGASVVLDGHNVVPGVHDVLDRMAAFADDVRDARWLGHTGRRVRTVINIGIGGSDLGPVMAYEALILQRAESRVALCLECGWHRLRRGHARSRPGRDAVRHLQQDVHHPGDFD